MMQIAHRAVVQLSILLVLSCAFYTQHCVAGEPAENQLAAFKLAWESARRGDHERFRKIMPGLRGYMLYPYLQYEDYRERGSRVPSEEMAAFLHDHERWAFTAGLRTAWLRSMAARGRWSDLVAHSAGVRDTKLRCQRARGQIVTGQAGELLNEARALWLAGKSQPKECDPVFRWLIEQGGVTESLAWERIRLAMLAGNASLVKYLERFVPELQRHWLDGWLVLRHQGFAQLDLARSWHDNAVTRMITAIAIERLASRDADRAAREFARLDGHFKWEAGRRAALLRGIALHAAVDLLDHTSEYMERVPAEYRDSTLLEWWARFLLGREDWTHLAAVIRSMPADTRSDERWRYWLAQSKIRSGRAGPESAGLAALAKEANYYGFLAADELDRPYNICPLEPEVHAAAVETLAKRDGFARALELRKAGLDNWASREWEAAVGRLPAAQLKTAAALAQREGWFDRVIHALGNGGERRFYAWRFPLLWQNEVNHYAALNRLDPAWVYGTIRSESAMLATARSSANALGLMQVTPSTGRRVSRKYGLAWRGSKQLETVSGNLSVGAAFMGELLRDYQSNPVLVSGAYNAGPRVVDRWLRKRPQGEAAIWIETLPYYETRDYIPRVLAFTTLYDWRLGGDVKRISARMPGIDSGKIKVSGKTSVVCDGADGRG